MRFSVTHARVWLLAGCLLFAPVAQADKLRIAVASNFKHATQALIENFEDQSGHKVVVSYGSTGKHYAQILNGAPFDLFLAADVERPRLLEEQGLSTGEPRHTYAIGRLVLWFPGGDLPTTPEDLLQHGNFRHLAIANPRLAPYGAAAKQVLEKLGVWEQLGSILVRGENIAQTYQFVASGNADLGLVAAAQISDVDQPGSRWPIPAHWHAPIEQQVVQLTDNPAAAQLMTYLRSPEAMAIIRQSGYDTSDAE
ncbi:MAG: molybdate ABC transporter substrate-binding protein [Pseudomonadota bacterium]